VSGTFQFLFVLAFAFLPVVSFAVLARSFLRRLRNPEQLGHAMSTAIENELRKAGIDPNTVKLQTATSAWEGAARPARTKIRLDALAAQDLPPEVMKAIQKTALWTLLGSAGTDTGEPRSKISRGPILPTAIDTPSRSDARLALIVLLVGFGMVVALMLRETL